MNEELKISPERTFIAQALARAYCQAENSNKELDAILIQSMVEEVVGVVEFQPSVVVSATSAEDSNFADEALKTIASQSSTIATLEARVRELEETLKLSQYAHTHQEKKYTRSEMEEAMPSDDEISKAAYSEKHVSSYTDNEIRSACASNWIRGAKWMRDSLKRKEGE